MRICLSICKLDPILDSQMKCLILCPLCKESQELSFNAWIPIPIWIPNPIHRHLMKMVSCSSSSSFQLLLRHCPVNYKGFICIIPARQIWKSWVSIHYQIYPSIGRRPSLCRLILTTLSALQGSRIHYPRVVKLTRGFLLVRIRNADHVIGAIKDWFDDISTKRRHFIQLEFADACHCAKWGQKGRASGGGGAVSGRRGLAHRNWPLKDNGSATTKFN